MSGEAVIVDAHVHLQPHGQRPVVDRARIELYVEHARTNGVDVVVFTEHLFRFHEAQAQLAEWWDADPDSGLAALTRAYWQDEANLSLPQYVRLIEQAKANGLPVRLGLEVDWLPSRVDELRQILAPYDWDLLLGSVHQLGAFQIDHEGFLQEWSRRGVDAVWEEYARWVEDLAGATLVDVLAHPDLPKVFGLRPSDAGPLHRRIAAAAARGQIALEINTNGLHKRAAEIYPHPEILMAARAAGVPVSLGSDAHAPERLGDAFAEAAMLARSAGYTEYVAFDQRQPHTLPLPPHDARVTAGSIGERIS